MTSVTMIHKNNNDTSHTPSILQTGLPAALLRQAEPRPSRSQAEIRRLVLETSG